MRISITERTNGIQTINRITFKGYNGKTTYVDLWDDECKELKEQIEQHFAGDENEMTAMKK